MSSFFYCLQSFRKLKPAIAVVLIVFFFLCPCAANCDEWVYETGDLRAVWGTAADDVFAVGKRGVILHFDGARWKPMDARAGDRAIGFKLKDIWGSSATDVYAIGCYDSQGEQFESCGENNGLILHYDGRIWEDVNTGGIDNLMGLWGSSASDIVAVGVDGTILRFDGAAWASEDSHTTETLTAVWGASGSDLFAVGYNGTILHYNGSDWSPMTSGTSANLYGVWGLSATDVFAVGSAGTVLHFNGTDWQPPAPPGTGTTQDLAHVWGSSASNVFAAGDGGILLRFNGSFWTTQASSTIVDLEGLWGSSGSNIFAVGDGSTILRYNGSSWAMHSAGSSEDLTDAWGTSDNNVFAVGRNGTIIRYSGSGWKPMDSGTSEYLSGVWGSSAGNVYAVGSGGTVVHYDGSSWTTIHSVPATEFYDVWGSSESDVYIVGSVETGDSPPLTARIFHYDGSTWTTGDFTYYDDKFYCVWGSSPSDIYTYTSQYVPGGGLGDPSKDVGYIFSYDGDSWPITQIGDHEYIYGFWGSGVDDVHAVGRFWDFSNQIQNYIIYHFDGNSWYKPPTDLPSEVYGANLRDIWGRSQDDVFAVGDIGSGSYHGHVILRNTGGAWWLDRFSRAFDPLYGIWGDPDGDAFAVGAAGVIMRLPFSDGQATSSGDPWAQTYGDMARDSGNAIAVTKDGGYIVAGQTGSFGGGDSDVWIVKLDLEGNLEWERRYGGSGGENASSILPTKDGGFIVAGETGSFGVDGSDVWILKLDGVGNVEWEKAYGGAQNDLAKDIQEIGGVDDVAYVVAAQTSSFGAGERDIWVFRLDAGGSIQWEKTYGGAYNEFVGSVALTKSDGVVVSGETHSYDLGNGDFWVLRLDGDGDIMWQKAFGLWSFVPPNHANHNSERGARLAATRDGGFILAGASAPLGTSVLAWIIKLDAFGVVQWQRLYDTPGDYSLSSIQQTADSGYVVGGKIGGRYMDGLVMKLDEDGNLKWQKAYGGSDRKANDSIAGVRQVPDGSYVATGQTFSADLGDGDMWVLKLDDSGDIPDCAAAGAWHGGSIATTEPAVDTPAAAADTAATVQTTSAVVNVTEAVLGDPCLSELGDIIDLPKTGQTNCYNSDGDPISCPSTGQDGDLQAGAAWPALRFVDNDDGTVTDNLTGLVWLKDANYPATLGTVPDATSDGRLTWLLALNFVADMNAGVYPNFGYTDWRAPNINEIESLIHGGAANPAVWLNDQGFSNVPSDHLTAFHSWYWSSTTRPSATNSGIYAWLVDFVTGRLETKQKRGSFYTWPVRAGQWFHPDPAIFANVAKTGLKRSWHPGDDGALQIGVAWPSPRFTDHEDGTVTDNLTGLMWLKDGNCFGSVNWQTALETVIQFNLDPASFGCREFTATYRDWRLPNRKEYPSLNDRDVTSYGSVTSLPLGHPFIEISGDQYWTSTTSEASSSARKNSAYVFSTGGALTDQGKRTYYNRVWPVRGGPKCYRDCDEDGDVDGSDLALFIVDFLAGNLEGPCSADFNEDELIDEKDLARLAISLGRVDCPVLDGE